MARALVTGSSTGIGFATAVALGRAGYDVVATMRRPDRSPELQELVTREELPVTVLPLDVNSDDSVANAFRAAGTIDVLVNNAGIGQNMAIEDAPLDHFREIMETNYFGALRCIKAVLPGMRERRGGAIVNVTSIAGRIASGGASAYAASKFALEAASEALAQEVKPFNIRVAVVEPGVIATPIFNKGHELIDTVYPAQRRAAAMFAASLTAVQISPDVVAERIVEIVEAESAPFRNPVGPDAEPFLSWRASISDEEFIALGGVADDEEWIAMLQNSFGLDVRPYLGKTPAGLVKA
jgi:NAD(P)-dependent dehydrogenase (short-subunit alcohol dehydrogenase family)